MNTFSHNSKAMLSGCHPALIEIFNRVILLHDCSVIEGHRSPERQRELYEAGRTKIKDSTGKHCQFPSMAIDVAPYLGKEKGVPWPKPNTPTYIKDVCQFYYFAGFVMAIAEEALKNSPYKLRWGGDWDRDHRLDDQTFDDLVHFELVNRYK